MKHFCSQSKTGLSHVVVQRPNCLEVYIPSEVRPHGLDFLAFSFYWQE